MEKPTPVVFESKSANIRGLFYRASGAKPLPTVVLCHGFPGNSTDILGLGERLMKSGFNALAFNYRGTWGSKGTFTMANSVEDVVVAMRYVKSTVAVREFNVDPSSIALIGASFGGGVALLGSLNDPAARRVVYIAGGDFGELGRMMQQSADFKRAIEKGIGQGISDSGFTAPRAEQLVAEILEDVDKYDLIKHAKALSCKDIFLIGGWRDQTNDIEHHILPLFRALQRHEAKQVQIEIFDTDHSFANVRSQLANKIISWLNRASSR
jgi:pimeloyl-ACP methyl ester carboxylesterase